MRPPGILTYLLPRNIIGALQIILLIMLFSMPVYAQGETPSDVLLVPAGQRETGSIATTGRAIRVEGEVFGDVTSWNGSIYITGQVHGDVVSYSGDITLNTNAHIDGNVLTVAGTVIHPPGNTQVAGTLINGTTGGNAVSSLVIAVAPGNPGEEASVGPGLRVAIIGVLLLMLVVLATFSTLIWPRRTVGASRTFAYTPWRSIALGSLTTLLFAALLLPATALIAMTLVGLPLLLPLLLLLHLPYVYGLATLGQALGRMLRAAVPERATALGVLVVLLPLALLAIVAPTASLVLLYLVAGAGLGAVIISRGGTLSLR